MITNIAHRGARSIAPENTILAALRAYEIGADLWETDVAVTADRQLILLHDRQLLRTTNVAQYFPERRDRSVYEFSLAEIRLLDAGSWFLSQDPFGQIAVNELTPYQIEAIKGEKIPTLEEALVFTKDRHWKINLELKSLPSSFESFPMVTSVLDLIDRVAIDVDQIIISSFNHEWLREINVCRPELAVQALIGETNSKPLNWGNFEFETYNVNRHCLDADEIKKAHLKKKKLNIFTVNEVAKMTDYIKMGIAGIFTDFPQRLKTLSNQ